MFKTAKLSAAGAAIAAIAAFAAPAHAADSVTASASAEILGPLDIQIANNSTMDFGNIVVPGSGTGTLGVVLATDGTVTCPASLTCSGTTSAVSFNVTGTAGSTVAISLPAFITVNGPSGASMTIGSLNTTGLDMTSGSDTFSLGGTLNVSPAQTLGSYSANYAVGVYYQ
jgi:hypothetical protein